jgi:hypothetical protein
LLNGVKNMDLLFKTAVWILAISANLLSPAWHVSQTTTDPTVEKHIEEVSQALPAGTSFRLSLERGFRGEGIHYSWMDDMRREGVKRVLIGVRFEWVGRPKDIKVVKIRYYRKYDADCAQITDHANLDRIRASGLTRELEDVAIQLAATSGRSFQVDGPEPSGSGGGTVELLDDEWLPHPPPLLGPLGNRPIPDVMARIADEASLVTRRASGHVSQEELDEALMAASGSTDDSCILKPLLKVGADPNFVYKKGGATPPSSMRLFSVL